MTMAPGAELVRRGGLLGYTQLSECVSFLAVGIDVIAATEAGFPERIERRARIDLQAKCQNPGSGR
jgi:hypothetical protein